MKEGKSSRSISKEAPGTEITSIGQFGNENDGIALYALTVPRQTAIFALFPAWHND
jgi:hypothetical protein